MPGHLDPLTPKTSENDAEPGLSILRYLQPLKEPCSVEGAVNRRTQGPTDAPRLSEALEREDFIEDGSQRPDVDAASWQRITEERALKASSGLGSLCPGYSVATDGQCRVETSTLRLRMTTRQCMGSFYVGPLFKSQNTVVRAPL